MKMLNVSLVSITALLVARGVFASQTIILPANVAVHADTLFLSDLLPENASNDTRAAAAQIGLGSSPHVGTERTIDRGEILRALAKVPDLAAELNIPPTIIVTRWSRSLTREEIATAINRALAANEVANSAQISSDDVAMDSPVSVTEEHPALDVTLMEPSTKAPSTHIALWMSSEPRTPSFWVTIDRVVDVSAREPIHSSTTPNIQRGNTSPATPAPRAVTSAHAENSSGAATIHAGKAIELVVQGANMRITTKATALETGREGQTIRVQCEPAGKVLVAKVVADQTAEVDY
jgi:hypothetical protein